MKKLIKEKEKAIKMRIRGMSYSQIREKIKVSKSTLSIWLEPYPLTVDRIRELRDFNPIRIEKSRNTKLKNRQEKLQKIYKIASEEIGVISKRDLFIAGLFLYWGEGTKSARDVVAFTNTDPNMIKFFIKWLELFNVKRNQLKIKLHLYSDMDQMKEKMFWSKKLGIPTKNFRKTYIKQSTLKSISYKRTFGHGTCSVIYGNSLIHNKIMMSLEYLRYYIVSV